MSRIGMLSLDANEPANETFRLGLRALGYVEGQNVIVEWRFRRQSLDEYAELAPELVRLPVDVIVAQGTAAIRAAKDASSATPIVMAFASDPVRAGLVATLARPGGNVTGLAALTAELSGKRLELLKDAIPDLARIAMVWNPGITDRAHEFDEAVSAARALGVDLHSITVQDGGELGDAFQAIIQTRADALFLQDNPGMDRYRPRIVDFAIENRLPTVCIRRDYVAAGCLMSYGPDFAAMSRRAAYYVDRILKGTKPADLPVEQPMTFDFVVNLKTARELGITFPNEIMLQVTEVIE